MAWEQEVKLLDEKNAQLVRYSDNELLYRKELVRVWPMERDRIVESCLDYLNQYATADNGTTPTARQWVDDPKASRLEYEDRWRVASNQKTSTDTESQWPGISGIIQTLRYGYNQDLTWDEARVVNQKDMPGNTSSVPGKDDTTSDDPNSVLVVEWVNLDRENALAMAQGTDTPGILNGEQITNPTIQTIEYTGVWDKISVTVFESPLEDGSVVIRAVLAQPQYTLNAYDSFITLGSNTLEGVVHYLWNVPRQTAQTVIDDWQASGRSASASLNSDDTVNIVLRWLDDSNGPLQLLSDRSRYNCSTSEATSYYWGVEDPGLAIYDIANGTYWPPLTGVTYSKNVSFNQSDGNFNVVIRELVTIDRTPYTDKTVVKGELVEQQETVKFGQTTLPDVSGSVPVGQIERLAIRVNPDCTNDSTLTTIISTEDIEIVEWDTEDGTAYAARFQNWDGITGPPDYTGDAQGCMDYFLATTGLTEAEYRVGISHTKNQDGTINSNINASPKSSRSANRGRAVGEKVPFNTYGLTVKTQNGTVSARYIVIVDRKVTADFEEARNFANDSDTHPTDGHRLGGITWSDRDQTWIALREQWFNDTNTPPYNGISDNNYSTLTPDPGAVPTRRTIIPN